MSDELKRIRTKLQTLAERGSFAARLSAKSALEDLDAYECTVYRFDGVDEAVEALRRGEERGHLVWFNDAHGEFSHVIIRPFAYSTKSVDVIEARARAAIAVLMMMRDENIEWGDEG